MNILIFLSSFSFYLWSACGSLAPYRDSGEMAVVSFTLGVAHPPGYPLYTLLGKMATFLPLGNIVYRVNLLSVLGGALAVLFTFKFLRKFMGLLPSAVGTLLLATSPIVGELSTLSEMYSWALAMTALLLYLAICNLHSLSPFPLSLGERGRGEGKVEQPLSSLPVCPSSQPSAFGPRAFFNARRGGLAKMPAEAKQLASALGRRGQEIRNLQSLVPLVYLLSFLFGLGLGLRMDIVLILPSLLIMVFPAFKACVPGNKRFIFLLLAFFAAGVSIFLYLYFRSNAGPLLDWRAPDTLAKVWEGITRKSYGGTLDLISSSYKNGENFWPQFKLYLNHLGVAFTPLGVILSVLGLFGLFRNNRRIAVATLVMFVVTSPLFLYAANMPPNPHAVAIVEAHYLMPDLAFAVWVTAGAAETARLIQGKVFLFISVSMALIMWNLSAHSTRTNKRWNLYDHDYAVNLFRSVKPHSAVVLKEDVQLFSAWTYTMLRGQRNDVIVIAHGLSGSEWYKNMIQRWPYKTLPDMSRLAGLNTVEDWNTLYSSFKNAGYDLSATVEVPLPDKTSLENAGLILQSYGLVSRIVPSLLRGDGEGKTLLKEIYLYRGTYNYSSAPDFFAKDLIGDYSAAYASLAQEFMNGENWGKAAEYFAYAGAINEGMPGVYMRQGYCNLMLQKYDATIMSYKRAATAFDKLLKEAEIYRSLPDVVEGLRKEAAEAWTGLGVVYERQANKEQARESFQSALRFNPDNAQAYYNLAVTYWGEDWKATARYLETACKLDGNYCERYEQAKRHFDVIASKAKQSQAW